MRTQRQVVDYALRRRALLADVHAGRVAVVEVCDAGPYLLQAAQFHGEGTDQTCPVCRKERLTLVSWVFGDALRQAAGTARRPDELDRLAAAFGDFTVHVVEVCRSCRWNHLVLSYVLGTGATSAPVTRGAVRAPHGGRWPSEVLSTLLPDDRPADAVPTTWVDESASPSLDSPGVLR